jgi:hypothetical protein
MRPGKKSRTLATTGIVWALFGGGRYLYGMDKISIKTLKPKHRPQNPFTVQFLRKRRPVGFLYISSYFIHAK